MLLSITPLVIVNIIEEEESSLIDEAGRSPTNQRKEKQISVKRRKDLISSLQLLGDYEGLLTVPQSLSLVANQAAAKAMMFVSGLAAGGGYLDYMTMNDFPVNCCECLLFFLF